MSEDQEDAIRNAWLDLSAMVEHISRIGFGFPSKACEELVKAGSDSVKELEENFEFLKQR
jgi:hypothetical protein